MTDKHSPLPWRREPTAYSNFFQLVAADGLPICHSDKVEIDTIIRAVNSHNELVALLEDADRVINAAYNQAYSEALNDDVKAGDFGTTVRGWRTKRNAALAKVKGQTDDRT